MGIPFMEKEGYEADDIIGTLAQKAVAENMRAVVLSGDKDFAQLVNKQVSMYDPMKFKLYRQTDVMEKWGVKPEQMVDYLALTGDASDNIPGVRGIGPKSAQKLLKSHHNLKQIYEAIPHLPKQIAKKLGEHKKDALLSQRLAGIVTNMPLLEKGSVKDHFKRRPADAKTLEELLKELGFKSFEQKFFEERKDEKLRQLFFLPQQESEVLSAKKNSSVRGSALSQQESETRPAVQQEKKSVPPFKIPSNSKIHVLSMDQLLLLIVPYAKIWIFSWGENDFLAYKNRLYSLKGMDLPVLAQRLSQKRVRLLGFDVKAIWARFPFQHPIAEWCTSLASYVLESAQPGDLKTLCSRYLDRDLDLDSPAGEVYNIHRKLQKELHSRLEAGQLLSFYLETELPLAGILYGMEQTGILVDPDELSRQSKVVTDRITAIERKITKYHKEPLNYSSPKQLSRFLFQTLGLEPVKKIKTGYSTSAEVLHELKGQHVVVEYLLEHRELFKLETTYLKPLLSKRKEQTGRVYTQFLQAFTTTGRLSSRNPNLQNIPTHTSQGRKVRKSFISPPRCVFISADYSQIELRILAHISSDPVLLSAFEKGQDIHQATASEVFGIPLDQVTASQRHSAKAINFGLVYGQGVHSLSKSLNISFKEGKRIIQNYFEKFKGVKQYMEDMEKEARQKGFVETLFKRRRRVSEINSHNQRMQSQGHRIAINSPIQGTASDIMKMAMVKLHSCLLQQVVIANP